MSTDIRNNRTLLDQAPPSEWLPNLRGRSDVPRVLVDAITRLHEDNQRMYQQLQEARASWVTVPAPTPVLGNTFVELNIGAPATGGTGAVRFRVGRGTPEGVVQGSAFKDVFLRLDGSLTTFLYVKTTGEGKTGWSAAAL